MFACLQPMLNRINMKENEKNLFSTMLNIVRKGTVVTLCLILVSWATSLSAQITRGKAEVFDYYPIITPDKVWNIEYGMACIEGLEIGCFCYSGLKTIRTGNTRTFNETEYYELLNQQNKVITYVREEEGKVFFYAEICDKEYLLYDFNLQVGDEVFLVNPYHPTSFYNEDNPCELTERDMEQYKCIVTEVDTIENRKRLTLDVCNSYGSDFWVEGIGCMKGITYQATSSMVGAVHQLKDCFESDELIFVNENPEYCWVSTIVNPNTWATLSYGLGAGDIPCNVKTEYVYFDGDSIIGDYSYKKVFMCDDKLHENIKYQGIMRDQNEKTYFIPANFETEYLLYDFSLEEGMSFEYFDFRAQESEIFHVKTVDFVEINGFLKKRIQLTYHDWVIDTWIEKIGSLTGILYPCFRYFITGGVRELLCYFRNDELFYKNPEYFECYYEGNDLAVPLVENNSFSVFPNPANDKFIISASDQTISNIEIFDILGKKIYSQPHGNTIDVSSFSKGLYLLKVYDTNGQVSSFKIIKK